MQNILKYFKNNQLLQFAVIGCFIFLLYKYSGASDQQEIIITQSTVSELIDLKSELLGYKLDEEDKQSVIDNYIDEEILLQEAYNQGLDRNDTKIRERLIDKMRFLMSKELEEPTEDTLKAFYNNHIDLYLKPEFITFDQVYFKNTSRLPNSNDFINQLENEDNFKVLGDSLWLGNQLEGYARTDLKIIFGEDFTSTLFTAEIEKWSGPINSQHGAHYVRIKNKVKAEAYPYENVKSFVREDWSVFQSQSTLKSQMEELKKGYKIQIID